MRLASRLLGLILAGAAARLAAQEPAAAPAEVEIPFHKVVLKNGLRVIVHEDHKAPIVAVNVWYHVGSKNERPGRTGFAHLFEHLMFNGSENYRGEFFTPFEQAGATGQNGTTNEDRTNYFENVPTNALDLALWMESDRMGHLLGALDQAKLDEQRGVVQNEKRQGENQPYGRVYDFLTPKLYPPNHPYSWTVIGSMEDLNAAQLDDVREWFRSYYGAANAVLVLAGDIDPKTALEKVERYFGDIPAGPPVARQGVWIARRTGHQRGVMEDRVPQARLYRVWNVPQWGSADADYLALAADILATGKTSRLYRRLVYEEQIATDVAAQVHAREIAGNFVLIATARPGDDLTRVERAVDQELARFLRNGPTEAELARAKTQYRARFIRGIERIGGFGGKSDVLAQGEVFAGRPDAYRTTLRRVARATRADLLGAARRWLADGDYTLSVVPFPEYRTAAGGADRSRLPVPGPPPEARFPELQRAKLSNGLEVVLAERRSIPQIRFELLLDAGFAADRFARPGTANLTLAMLDEGTTTRTALQIGDELARLGANLGTLSRLDFSSVWLEALSENLDRSLELYADVILHPSFPERDLERLKRIQIAQIRQERVEPLAMGLRVLPLLIYGPGHPYATPWTGTGTEESVRGLTRRDVLEFHRTWFKPNHATLVVVGATTLEKIRPTLERLFAAWRPGEIPAKNVGEVARQPRSVVYLVDRPGAIQSVIFAGDAAPPPSHPDEVAMEVMNQILGGQFGSRINLNLREDKHWSYGAFSVLRDARGPRPFFVYAPVQTDKTKDAIGEIRKELSGILGERPVDQPELAKAQASLTLTLPGEWETMAELATAIRRIVTLGLDDRYYDTYAPRVRGVDARRVPVAAAEVIRPDRLVWVVVGDRARIEADLRALDLGEIRLIDPDGKPSGV